jgi:hypothetical protein
MLDMNSYRRNHHHPIRLRRQSLRFFIDDPCPICSQPVKFAEIELHPSRRDLAIHKYYCIDCGPVTGKTYSLKPGDAEQAA